MATKDINTKEVLENQEADEVAAMAAEISSEISPMDAVADIEMEESATEAIRQTIAVSEEKPVRESRVKKTLLNAKVNLIFYFLALLLGFFTRKVFLDCLGSEFIGLTGTLSDLLGFLNLAELGVGTAISYLLYKPLFDHNKKNINEIISVLGYLYRCIGLLILFGGIVVSCFLPQIFPSGKTEFSLLLIYIIYYSFLISSLIGYFLNYKSMLLSADQKGYMVTAYFQTANIVKTLIQLGLALWTHSYYLWVIIELLFGILYSFILNWKINMIYPWLNSEIKQGKILLKKYPEVFKKTGQIFCHRLAEMLILKSKNILIYMYASLNMVAFYGNYMLFADKLFAFLGNFIGSISASVGNLVAEGDEDKTRNIFYELLSLSTFFGGCMVFFLFEFSNDLIRLWIGKKYVLSLWIIAPAYILCYIESITSMINKFIYAQGLFQDVWSGIAEGIIYIIGANLLGWKFGLGGVLLGGAISGFTLNLLWKPYFLYSKGFKTPLLPFWIIILKYTMILLCSSLIICAALNKIEYIVDSWQSFILKVIVVAPIYLLINLIAFYTTSKHFRKLIDNRILPIFIRNKITI